MLINAQGHKSSTAWSQDGLTATFSLSLIFYLHETAFIKVSAWLGMKEIKREYLLVYICRDLRGFLL